jgi:hypothetical protein
MGVKLYMSKSFLGAAFSLFAEEGKPDKGTGLIIEADLFACLPDHVLYTRRI